MKKKTTCWMCEKEFSYDPNRSSGQFCSNACQGLRQRLEYVGRWMSGSVDGGHTGKCNEISSHIRTFLTKDIGICSICNKSEWNGQRMPLEIDHINGDASDHSPENIRAICPNCHTFTPTFKGKNIGNGKREYRK